MVEPFEDAGVGNTPPVVRFESGNKTTFTGPPHGFGATYTVKSGDPLPITVWVTDDGKIAPEDGATARLRPSHGAKFRGPGSVTFDDPRPKLALEDGKASTTAQFTDPGDYVLRLQANDPSGDGGGGFQCWTNVHVKVTVTKN